jgi:hypothetical protein
MTAKSTVHIAWVVGALLVGLCTQASACISGGAGAENKTVDASMEVKSGGYCSYSLHSGGPVEKVTLTKRAAVGVVELSGLQVRYRAKRGYVGKDEFVVTVRGRTMLNAPYIWSMRVLVTVIP